jgi:hypothetical protein
MICSFGFGVKPKRVWASASSFSSDATTGKKVIAPGKSGTPVVKKVVPAINSNISSADVVLKAAVKADHARKS